MKKCFALLIAVTLIFSVFPFMGIQQKANAISQSEVKTKLDVFIQQYPHGSTWTGSFDSGSECYGFAKMVVYNLFDKYNSSRYRSWLYNGTSTSGINIIGQITDYSASNVKALLSNAAVGDVLQFDESYPGSNKKMHSMIVYSVESDGVNIYHCNWDNSCGVHLEKFSFGSWSGRTSARLSLLRSDNYDPGIVPPDNYSTGVYRITANSGLIIRSMPSTSGDYLGLIPNGTEVNVTQTSTNWGYTSYSGVGGWICLDYASRIGDIPTRSTSVRAWIGDANGNSKDHWYLGEQVFLWYKIYDKNTGDLYNSYSNSQYTVTLTLYKPNGEVSFSSSYENSDLNWIGHGLVGYDYGKCSGKVEIAFSNGTVKTLNVSFNAECNATLTVDKTSLSLDLAKQKTGTVVYTINGTWPENTKVKFDYDQSIMSMSTANGPERQYTGLKTGETDVRVIAYLGSVDNVLRSVSTHVTVGCSHVWNSGVVTTAATCTTNGVKTYTCTVCNATRTETISATGHSYGAWAKLNDTQHQRICAYNSSHKETASHTWNSGVVNTAATCTTTGIKTYTCSVCKTTKTEMIAKATTHTWDSGKVTKAATCAATGVKTYTCSVCKTSKTETIAKTTTHTWDSGKVTKAATCAATGVKTFTCSVCKTTKTETIAKTTSHTWDSGKVTKAATCAAAGVKTYTCSVCKTTKTETIAKTTSHTWDAGKVTKAATNAEAGVKTYTCTVCGTTKTETIPPQSSSPASNQPTISVGTITANAGDQIEVPVSIANNPGINTFALGLNYNKAKLSLTGVTVNPALGGQFAFKEKAIWLNATDTKYNGPILTLIFKVSTDATNEDLTVSVAYQPGDISNLKEEDVTFQVVPGKISVRTYLPGDINSDGKVNNKDLTRLMKYLAGENVTVVSAALDVNGDGKVNNKDLTRLMKYLAGENVSIY